MEPARLIGNPMAHNRKRLRFGSRFFTALVSMMLLMMLGGACTPTVTCLAMETSVALIDPLDGEARLRSYGSTDWETIFAPDCLAVGDAVQALGSSDVVVFFRDGSRVLLAPGTRVSISAFAYGQDYRIARLVLEAGRMTFSVSSQEQPVSLFQIVTPGSDLSIAGTTGQIAVDADDRVISSTIVDGGTGDAILTGRMTFQTGGTAFTIVDLETGSTVHSSYTDLPDIEKLGYVTLGTLMASSLMPTHYSALQATNLSSLLASLGVNSETLKSMFEQFFAGLDQVFADHDQDFADHGQDLESASLQATLRTIYEALFGEWIWEELSGEGLPLASLDPETIAQLAEGLLADISSDLHEGSDTKIDVAIVCSSDVTETEIDDSENPLCYRTEDILGFDITEAAAEIEADVRKLLEAASPTDIRPMITYFTPVTDPDYE
jgi:hypothetical protein